MTILFSTRVSVEPLFTTWEAQNIWVRTQDDASPHEPELTSHLWDVSGGRGDGGATGGLRGDASGAGHGRTVSVRPLVWRLPTKTTDLMLLYWTPAPGLRCSRCRAAGPVWSPRAPSSLTCSSLHSCFHRSGLSRCQSPYLGRLIDDGLGRYKRDLCGGGGGGGATG